MQKKTTKSLIILMKLLLLTSSTNQQYTLKKTYIFLTEFSLQKITESESLNSKIKIEVFNKNSEIQEKKIDFEITLYQENEFPSDGFFIKFSVFDQKIFSDFSEKIFFLKI